MINFNDKRLVSKHGSWVRVVVVFYDYLMTRRHTFHPQCAIREAEKGTFSDGDTGYEQLITMAEKSFESQEELWGQFIEYELGNN